MTAAHCVYNTETDRFYRIVDGLGDDVRPAWRIAVGRSENWPYVTPDCFQVHVPGAFIGGATANDVPEHDYAVIDFSQDSRGPCRNPEPAPQWLGSWITYDDELREDQPWCRFGYPRYVHQGGGPIGGPGLTDQYRSILNAYVDANPWWILRSNWKDTQLKLQGPFLRHNLDASKGDSGSPTLRYDGSGWYVVGLHNASSNGQLRDRRWDWTVRNWVYGKKPF